MGDKERFPDPDLAARRSGMKVMHADASCGIAEPWPWVSPREIIEGGDDPGTDDVREPRPPRPPSGSDRAGQAGGEAGRRSR